MIPTLEEVKKRLSEKARKVSLKQANERFGAALYKVKYLNALAAIREVESELKKERD